MPVNYRDARYRISRGFSKSESDRPKFSGLRPRVIGRAEGVLEHVVQEHDRLDLLALHYYNDSRRWWRIVDANPEVVFSGEMLMKDMVGSIVLIPRADESEGGG